MHEGFIDTSIVYQDADDTYYFGEYISMDTFTSELYNCFGSAAISGLWMWRGTSHTWVIFYTHNIYAPDSAMYMWWRMDGPVGYTASDTACLPVEEPPGYFGWYGLNAGWWNDYGPVSPYPQDNLPTGLTQVEGSGGLSSTKAITAFDFTTPAVTGTIDSSAKTILLIVSPGTDVSSLTPTITFTGASVSPASGVAQDFTNPVTYTVTAQDSSTQDYNVTVTDLIPMHEGFIDPSEIYQDADDTYYFGEYIPTGSFTSELASCNNNTGVSGLWMWRGTSHTWVIYYTHNEYAPDSAMYLWVRIADSIGYTASDTQCKSPEEPPGYFGWYGLNAGWWNDYGPVSPYPQENLPTGLTKIN